MEVRPELIEWVNNYCRNLSVKRKLYNKIEREFLESQMFLKFYELMERDLLGECGIKESKLPHYEYKTIITCYMVKGTNTDDVLPDGSIGNYYSCPFVGNLLFNFVFIQDEATLEGIMNDRSSKNH